MKKVVQIAIMAIAIGLFVAITAPKAHAAINDNPYISKVYPITNATNKIYIDTTSEFYMVDSLTIDIDGKETAISFWEQYINMSSVKEGIVLPKKFTANSTVSVYANIIDFDDNFNEVNKKILIDTQKVSDRVAPNVKASALTVRTNKVTLTSEENATLAATYNSKKLALKKTSATTWTATITKPLKGKKLVVTATDKAKNKKSYPTVTSVPKAVSLKANSALVSTKKLTGTVKSAATKDTVQFKVGSKTYKAAVKNGKFTINFPKTITTPKNITVKLVDQYGNVLDEKAARIYQYKKLTMGMTTKQAANTLEGKPADVSKHKYGKYTAEYWTYYKNDRMTMIVSFENGKIDSISKFK